MSFESSRGNKNPESSSWDWDAIAKKSQAELGREAKNYASEHADVARIFDELLNPINMNSLKEVFLEDALRSGVLPTEMNFIPREHIYLLGEENDWDTATFGYYNPMGDYIAVRAGAITSIERIKDPATQFCRFLRHIIHEEGHAASTRTLGMRRVRTGYHVQEGNFPLRALAKRFLPFYKQKPPRMLFFVFNEGVNEMISDRIIRRYLDRYPATLKNGQIVNTKSYETALKNFPNFNSRRYSAYQAFVEQFSEYIERICGMPAGKVQEALIAGFYSGTDLPEDLLDETVGPGFTRALADADTGEKLIELVGAYNFPNEHGEGVKEEISRKWRSYTDRIKENPRT